MEDRILVIYSDIIRGNIISGWALFSDSEEELTIKIKMWFRENKKLSLEGRTYQVSTLLECLHFEPISLNDQELLARLFGEHLTSDGVYGVFPTEVF